MKLFEEGTKVLFTAHKPFQKTAWAQFPRAAGHSRGWL